MKARSAKNKGNRFENYLVEEFKKIDPKAHRTYGSGNGLDKNDIRLPKYDIEIEAKNQQNIALGEWWNQLKRQTLGGNRGILAIRNPRRAEFEETFIVLALEDFIQIVAGGLPNNPLSVNEGLEDPIFSPSLRFKGQRARQAIQDFLRELDPQ